MATAITCAPSTPSIMPAASPQAVAAGRLTSGVMYECVKANVPFVLAGSLRDDGPLPDRITDMNAAQDAYAEQLKGAGVVLCLSSMLHSIATGNMLPAWVKIVCVDINPAVPTKVSDRGTGHAVGVVTDVGLFLELLARKSESSHEEASPNTLTIMRRSGVDAPLPEIETWPNQYPPAIEIEISMPEFTSVCPKTGLPDHGIAQADLHAEQALSGIEVAEDVHARLSQSGDLSGEHRESLPGRCRAGLRSGRGDRGWRFHAARRDLDPCNRKLQKEERKGSQNQISW